jgi:hypothetical protein
LATARESQVFDAYLEFLAGAIYPPAYLSLDYVLHQHGLLTEMPHNFTAVAKNKTARFSSALGNFFFHKIKDSLFTGFTVTPVRLKRHMLLIFKATKAKALFDYLYLRKNILTDRESVRALRLNTRLLTGPERREVERLARLEGSHKMAVIIKHLW